MDAPEGMTKIIADPESGRILGFGIVGRDAGEMIAEGVLAIEMGALAEDVALTIHAHPTLSETEGEVAELFLGSATHLLPPRHTVSPAPSRAFPDGERKREVLLESTESGRKGPYGSDTCSQIDAV